MAVKHLKEWRGLKVECPVLILRVGEKPQKMTVLALGPAGFVVKEHMTMYHWTDNGVTWKMLEK